MSFADKLIVEMIRRKYRKLAKPGCRCCGSTGIKELYFAPGETMPKVMICKCTG
jgi:hypothetical protein